VKEASEVCGEDGTEGQQAQQGQSRLDLALVLSLMIFREFLYCF
jgi:hypothetical protein